MLELNQIMLCNKLEKAAYELINWIPQWMWLIIGMKNLNNDCMRWVFHKDNIFQLWLI